MAFVWIEIRQAAYPIGRLAASTSTSTPLLYIYDGIQVAKVERRDGQFPSRTLRTSHADALANQLSVFQAALHNFSLTHAKDIRSNPTFRAEFARMCNAIGVDPLAGSNVKGAAGAGGKSVWAKMLGSSVNDFYFELAVRVVEVCRETRNENGGMIALSDVKKRIEKGRGLVGGGMEVTEDDIERALESLEPLGGMFKTTMLGSNKYIRSVPKELNPDQATVLEVIQVLGYVTVSMLRDNLGWERARAIAIMEDLVADSLVWVDFQAEETEYWSPAWLNGGG
ncbi:ESCRT II complex subunit Dot2 [Saxophila tyrrhenica]|uniref:ESCRT II complex subunit Dot2 n=1 Tax=Saxophila tyrrhenica TaxID=1690608 RepID=A0AAV9PAJ1_9PEZI|nr:ESCRT II complex subunit Dot2 [Saxophila tyrrhenica]